MSRLNDLETFRNMLRVNKHRLDDELEMQPEIMDRICSAYATVSARAAELKNELVKLEGRLFQEFKEDDPKLSNPMVEAKVARNKEREEAFKAHSLAVHTQHAWEGLRDAWIQKGYSLKTLSDLYGMQYFQIDHTTGYAVERPRRDSVDTEGRAAIRQASREHSRPERHQRESLFNSSDAPSATGVVVRRRPTT